MTDPIEDALKACPFCGGRAEVMVDFTKYYTRVACRECPCLTLWRETTASAIAAWNRRAQEKAVIIAQGVKP